MPTTVRSPDEFRALSGQHLGWSDWFVVDQARVDLFADATDDHQWIHVDLERATAESPFGGPIGHGFLTLSLFVPMWSQVLVVTDVKMGVNYGLNKVRFPAPVPVGARIRLVATLIDLADVKGGVQLLVGGVMEREGSEKPVCVLEAVMRLYG
jgi:acyl dehydratase